MTKRRLCLMFLLLAIALGVGGYFRYWRYNLRRFAVVHPGVLYRSALPSQHGLDYLVHTCGVRTVLCIFPEEMKLKGGLFFPWGSTPVAESTAVESRGGRLIRWSVDEKQVYWPWPQPEQFDQFFRIFDDPKNYPVTVHCLQGRHRTGTCAALFRLEYDRWDAERALAEMYSFDFGQPVRLQEHHLRTYWPRPRPSVTEWASLKESLAELLPAPAPADYEELVRRLRALGDTAERGEAVRRYAEEGGPFGLCLAARLLERPDDRLVAFVGQQAALCLEFPQASADDWAVSAAILADYGTPAQQTRLVELLEQERTDETPSPHYQALVAGVTNRYTANRAAYLLPLLSDTRLRPEPAAHQYRYCDTAAARLATITNEAFFRPGPAADRAIWDAAVERARAWFAQHPEAAQPNRTR